MNDRLSTVLLRVSAVLWGIWGVFHLMVGIALLWFVKGEHPQGQLSEVPGLLEVTMMGNDARFATIASLEQHFYNLAWFGLLVTIGGVLVWRRNVQAIFFTALIGGLADLGYFTFVDLAGYADPPGPQMTWICATAIILSFIAYFRPATSVGAGAASA